MASTRNRIRSTMTPARKSDFAAVHDRRDVHLSLDRRAHLHLGCISLAYDWRRISRWN